jgi:hypothetical protein
VVLGVLAAFVLLGATGTFGIRTRTVSAAGNGYRLTVTYPAVDRPVQPIRLVAVIGHDGGFQNAVGLGLTHEYMNLLDFNDIEPQPATSHAAGEFVVWTFDQPVGDTLTITFDAFIESNSRFGLPATMTVFDGAVPVVSVSFRTWVAP